MDEGLLRFRLGQDGAAQTLYVSGELDIASAPVSSQPWPGPWTDRVESSASTSVP